MAREPIIHYGYIIQMKDWYRTPCGKEIRDTSKLTMNTNKVTCKRCGHIVWGT